METDLRLRAERAATARLRELRPQAPFLATPPGYLAQWNDNLVEGVTRADFEADLRRGSGNELTDRPDDPAKFRAAFSSAALAVNTFAPFRHHPARLVLAGVTGFERLEFEYACDNGLIGTNPNFDLFACTTSAVVALESKFLEPLRPKPAAFSDQYDRPFQGTERAPAIAEPAWTRMYQRLRSDPQSYRHLDAAQLVKHYLGLVHAFPALERTLVYLYWQPDDAVSHPEYRDLQREVADFAAAVAGCRTRFVALSYPALWLEWQHNRSQLDLSAHIARLRQRYAFPIE